MGKVKESETFVEIGGYLYKDQGNVRTALHVGDVNKTLHPDEAEEVIRLKKVRVTMNVSEDKSVQKNKVYEKDINMVQEIIGEPSGKMAKTGGVYDKDVDTNPTGNNGTLPEPSPLQVLKNFVDKIADGQTAMWVVIVGIAILAAVALGLSVLG